MRKIALAVALFSSLVAPAGASAAPGEAVKEPSTGVQFETTRTVDGRPFALLGAGVRKKVFVKVYAMALYVDESEARRAFPALVTRAGGHDHAKLVAGDHAQSFVLWGTFAKLGLLRFVRTVEAEKIQDAFKEGLEDELSGKAGPEQKSAAEQFLALFDREMKEGEEIVLRTSADGKIDVELGGVKKAGPQSPKLARAVWGIWIGAKPISTDLRRALVERIELLAKP